jgi:SWI/SNF-related matrix-associated actin-dependent regulator 1 of chromatin subfamily A
VAAALSLSAPPIQRSILVLCPASVKVFWARELQRWAGLEATVVSGMNGPPIKGLGVWVMNYRLAPARIPSGAFFQAVILDEAHYIKTLSARRSAAVHSLRSVVRWALTGTPVLNRPAELYSVLYWLDPLGWPRKRDYYKKFCGMFYGPRGLDISGATNLGLLRARLQRTVLIRRTKAQVLSQLPPKRYQVLERAGAQETSRWSESVLEAAFGQNEDLGEMPPEDFFSRLGRLRFLAAGPMAEHVATARRLLGVSKISWAIEEIRDHLRTGEPLVVWAWHREVLQALKKAFPRAEAITGSTPSGARQRAVERFQEGRTNLFLGQIQAAGQGITLTRASTALFVEVDWVPANLSQAEDRIHRIGQQNPCLYKFLVWAGSLDALVLQKVREKRKVLDELWG